MKQKVNKMLKSMFATKSKTEQINDLKADLENLHEILDSNEEYYNEQITELKQQNSMYKLAISENIKSNLSDILNNMETKELMVLYRTFDDGEGWQLKYACEELLGKEDIEDIFYCEALQGYFAEANGYEITDWREKYYLGVGVKAEYIQCYEQITYAVDYESDKFKEYEKKLYQNAIMKLVDYNPQKFIELCPNILTDKLSINECLNNEEVTKIVDKDIEFKKSHYGIENYKEELEKSMEEEFEEYEEDFEDDMEM